MQDGINLRWICDTFFFSVTLVTYFHVNCGKYCYQDKDGNWAKNEAIGKGKWVHVTLVVDAKDSCEYGEKGKDGYVKGLHGWTYINGKLYGNGTIANKTMSNSNRFFLGINAWDIPFKGYFDDVKFWDKALTAKQVKAVYKS